jgi:hypothetical protein
MFNVASVRKNLMAPKAPKNKIPVQAKIDADLHAEVEKQLEKDGKTWTDLIVASFESYLEESKKK